MLGVVAESSHRLGLAAHPRQIEAFALDEGDGDGRGRGGCRAPGGRASWRPRRGSARVGNARWRATRVPGRSRREAEPPPGWRRMQTRTAPWLRSATRTRRRNADREGSRCRSESRQRWPRAAARSRRRTSPSPYSRSRKPCNPTKVSERPRGRAHTIENLHMRGGEPPAGTVADLTIHRFGGAAPRPRVQSVRGRS